MHKGGGVRHRGTGLAPHGVAPLRGKRCSVPIGEASYWGGGKRATGGQGTIADAPRLWVGKTDKIVFLS